MITPHVSPGPYYWHEAQYTLQYNTIRQTWDLCDVSGAVVVAYTRRFMHIRQRDNVSIYGWYLDNRLVACTPLEAVNRYLAACDAAGALVAGVIVPKGVAA